MLLMIGLSDHGGVEFFVWMGLSDHGGAEFFVGMGLSGHGRAEFFVRIGLSGLFTFCIQLALSINWPIRFC